MLVRNGGDLDGTGVNCTLEQRSWSVRHQQRPTCRSIDRAWAQPAHLRPRGSDPEGCVANSELRDDIVAFANKVEHFRPESVLVEGHRLASTLNPEFRLDIHLPTLTLRFLRCRRCFCEIRFCAVRMHVQHIGWWILSRPSTEDGSERLLNRGQDRRELSTREPDRGWGDR